MNQKFFKARRRFSTLFFCVIVPLFAIFLIVFYFLQKKGILNIGHESTFGAVAVIGMVCIIIGFVTAYFLMNMIFKPLEWLSEASKEVAKGNYRIQVQGNSSIEEVDNTVRNFNFMVRELNSVEMMRSDFIANVSHEFKTPLASISGYATLLQDDELSKEERAECVKKLLLNAERLNDLTGNILQLSKLENQNTLPEPSRYRLDEQIRESIVLLEPKWSRKNTCLDIELEEVTYLGQKELLFHVWQNLIGNAIKFTQTEGKVSVSLKQDGEKITVQVMDDGLGMDAQTQNHIFEKFYQGDISHQAQGNGLGLALCKSILERCQGEIQVESEPGKGSVFTVILQKNIR